MSRGFLVISIVWTAAVAASSMLLIEALDGRGWTATIPGLPTSATEALIVGAVAAGGIAVLYRIHRRRRPSRGD